jgi:transposase
VIAVQMAWLWLRYQSKSELSLWYYRRVGDLKGRVRRIMIIALARKLVIALWRYVETGKVPNGAIVTSLLNQLIEFGPRFRAKAGTDV